MNKKFFIIIAFIHIFLVFANITIYDYQQLSDAPRYIAAANDFSPFTPSSFHPADHFNTAPAYPLFLASIQWLTQHNKFLIALCQTLLFLAALYYLLFNLHRQKIINSFTFYLGWLLILCCPEIFESNGVTLTESFCGSLLLFSVGFVCKQKWHIVEQILFVFIITLLIITKFEYLLILPIICLPLLLKRQYHIFLPISLFLVAILTLNGYKNKLIFDQFHPFSFSSGSVIYGGNNLNGDGSWHIAADNLDYLPPNKITIYQQISQLSDKEKYIHLDTFYKHGAIAAWQHSYWDQLQIIPLKFLKLWVIPQSMDFYTMQTNYSYSLLLNTLFDDKSYPWYAKYKHSFYLFIHWIYLMTILIGFILVSLKKRFFLPHYFIITLFLLISFLYSIPFYGLGRFHVPIFSLLIIYAAITIEQFQKRLMVKNK